MRARDIFIIGSIILCVGIVFGFITLIMYSGNKSFKANASKTTSEVVSIKNDKIIVKYDVEGKAYEEELETFSNSLYEGKQVDIYYRKNDPTKIIDETKDQLVVVLAIVAGILFLVGVFVDMFAVDKRKKNKLKLEV